VSGRFWIGAVVGLLVGNAAAMVILVAAAGADSSHHVVDDYYRKALAWDQEMAADRASRELGWTGRIHAGSDAAIELALIDGDGAPVSGAAVRASAFHRAAAADVQVVDLTEVAPGRYRGRPARGRAGIHELQVTAERGAARWRQAAVLDLPGARP
jgi:nitrogen fixation protein FixH